MNLVDGSGDELAVRPACDGQATLARAVVESVHDGFGSLRARRLRREPSRRLRYVASAVGRKRSIVINLTPGGEQLEVWRSAASAMPQARVGALLPDFRELVGDAFPGLAAAVGDEDLVKHCLGPTFGAYQSVEGRVRALTTADFFDLEHGRALYFSLSAIHSSLRGRGLYEQMLLLRIAIGRSLGCEWWATRTQSPIVAHSFERYGCYPWLDDELTPVVATEVANVLYEQFSALGRREGEMFNPTTGVLHDAYPTGPYQEVPAVDNVRVQSQFDAHLESSTGDALLLVGRLDAMADRLAPRCDARFGLPFDRLCELLSDL